jgi:hypothetical protein
MLVLSSTVASHYYNCRADAILIRKLRKQSRSEEWERMPLETVIRRLVKTMTEETSLCMRKTVICEVQSQIVC